MTTSFSEHVLPDLHVGRVQQCIRRSAALLGLHRPSIHPRVLPIILLRGHLHTDTRVPYPPPTGISTIICTIGTIGEGQQTQIAPANGAGQVLHAPGVDAGRVEDVATWCLSDHLSCFDLLQTYRACISVGGQLFGWEHGHQVLEMCDVVVLVPSGDHWLGWRVAAPSDPLPVDEDPHSNGDNQPDYEGDGNEDVVVEEDPDDLFLVDTDLDLRTLSSGLHTQNKHVILPIGLRPERDVGGRQLLAARTELPTHWVHQHVVLVVGSCRPRLPVQVESQLQGLMQAEGERELDIVSHFIGGYHEQHLLSLHQMHLSLGQADGDGRDVAVPDEAGVAPTHRAVAEAVGVGWTGAQLVDGEDRGQEKSKNKDQEPCLLNADHHNINVNIDIDIVQSVC